MPTPRFPSDVVAAAGKSKSFGVRSGDSHKFTWVWVIAHDGRLFVRSWGDTPTGWYRAFLAEPDGAMRVARTGEPIAARARKVRGEKLLDAIDAGYAAKYPAPGSRHYVEGFREPERRARTLELVPR